MSADPLLSTQNLLMQQDKRSPLAKALLKAKPAERGGVSFCKFGCPVEALDDLGHCDHLVGFTDPADERYYFGWTERDARGRRQVDGSKRLLVQKGDRLERITACSRVYRDVPKVSQEEFTDEQLELATRP